MGNTKENNRLDLIMALENMNCTRKDLEVLSLKELETEYYKLLLVGIGEDIEDLEEMSLEELKGAYEDYEDTSAMHPNETLEEFLEHEDF